MVAGIGLTAISTYALLATGSRWDALTLGVVLLIQSLLSFFIGISQLFSTRFRKDGLKQMLISGVLLLIGFGVCSQGNLNIH